ncbi:hypothetical protein [Lentimonas sp. CC4]|uniref:hypothetical protein n=1 Tax=Lentimonas sp. CC4 TaxID=2676099 RepID=UPI00138A3236|nr:hypothetical protein [Lentimonas sp. CC4]
MTRVTSAHAMGQSLRVDLVGTSFLRSVVSCRDVTRVTSAYAMGQSLRVNLVGTRQS